MKILAVDDERTSRSILARTLKRLGHVATVASDGRQALEILAAERMQLVVTDWMMPEMDGLELTRRIREQRSAPYVYVLLLTSVEGRENWLQAMQAGADDFLPKPVDSAVLGARVRVAERILDLTARNNALARLIPICMYCKKARDDSDYWMDLDRYLIESGDSMLSHGVCPECNVKHVAPMLRADAAERAGEPPTDA